MPDYDHFLEEGNDLETYAGVCRQIVSMWGTDEVIEYIEQCLVRSSVDELGHNFDLEAFRDLLLLHGLMRRMDRDPDSDLIPFIASRVVNTSASETVPILEEDAPQPRAAVPGGWAGAGAAPSGVPGRRSWFEQPPGEESQGALVDFDLSGVSKLGPLDIPKE